jgi:hypothetical protein
MTVALLMDEPPDDPRLEEIEHLLEEELVPALTDPTSDDFHKCEIVGDMCAALGGEVRVQPDWDMFDPISFGEVQDLREAIAEEDVEFAIETVHEMASHMGLVF